MKLCYKSQFKKFMQMYVLFYKIVLLFRALRRTQQEVAAHLFRTADLGGPRHHSQFG
jgi:hypothetical protein